MTTKRIIAALSLTLVSVTLAAEVVTWDPNPASENVTTYRVYWSASLTTPLPLWTLLATVASTNTLAVTNSATGRYFYYVIANNGSDSDPSDIAFRPGKTQHVKVNP